MQLFSRFGESQTHKLTSFRVLAHRTVCSTSNSANLSDSQVIQDILIHHVHSDYCHAGQRERGLRVQVCVPRQRSGWFTENPPT